MSRAKLNPRHFSFIFVSIGLCLSYEMSGFPYLFTAALLIDRSMKINQIVIKFNSLAYIITLISIALPPAAGCFRSFQVYLIY